MRTVLGLALSGAAYAAAILAWTTMYSDHPLPAAMDDSAFLGSFVAVGLAFIVVRKQRAGKLKPGLVRQQIRRPQVAEAVVLAAIVSVIVGALLLTAFGPDTEVVPGQPAIVGGQYVQNNHGVVSPITREQYLRAQAGSQRMVAFGALIFYLVAAGVVAAASKPIIRTSARMHRLVNSR